MADESEHPITRLVFATLLVLLLSFSAPPAESASKIKVLYHGDALEQDQTSLLLYSDPMLGVTRVPSHAWRSDYDLTTIRRFLRLYMPRNYEQLRDYGLIILSDASRTVFTTKELTWFERGVIQDGVCLTMIGGYDSFGGSHGTQGWSGTTVEEILPVALIEKDTGSTTVRMSIKDPGNPLMKALGPMDYPPFLGMNLVETKLGAHLLATGKWMKGEDPLMVHWDPGGRSFALTADWNGGWGENFLTWPGYPTYASLTTYFAAAIELPQDIAMYHSLRSLFYEYPTRRGLVTSLLEFVEKFGVSSSPVLVRVAGIDSKKNEAEELFLTQEYEEAIVRMVEINEEFRSLSVDLLSLKEKALFWVYMVEWLAVMGTAMICGTILWTLMVRRRLYRIVSVTRSTSS